MKIRLLLSATAVVAFAVVPGLICASLFGAFASDSLDRAGAVIETSRSLMLSAQSSIQLATDASSSSANSSKLSLLATAEVLGSMQTLVLQMHARAMEHLGSAVRRRLDAAEAVTNALHKAWELGFVKSCNLNSSELTLRSFMAQFLELDQPFPAYFKYIYFDEPNSLRPGKFTDCGWGNSPYYSFYAMGNDQRYVYWGSNPNVGSDDFLWKDTDNDGDDDDGDEDGDTSFVRFSARELLALQTNGVLWDSFVFAEVTNRFRMTPVLLYSRSVSTVRNGTLRGIFGADLDMGFLSSALESSLVSPQSRAFIIDLGQNQSVIAHTFPEIPLFTKGRIAESFVPFTAQGFPSGLMQACLKDLMSSYGSLESVPAMFSEFT
eukprot:RCo051740